MKQRYIIGCLCLILIGCQQEGVRPDEEASALRNLTVEEQELVQSVNTFAFDLVQDIVQYQPHQNAFLSPYSINMVLSMTLNGAAAATSENLYHSLEHDVITPLEINKAYSQLTPFLQQLDPQVDFALANAVWHTPQLVTDPLRQDMLTAYYQAHVSEMNFKRRRAPHLINKWVEEQTHHQITELVEELDPSALVYLTTAVQFAGAWASPFQEKNTAQGTFRLDDGRSITTNIMYSPRAQYHFYQDKEKTILDIPYGDQQYSMTMVMPAEGDSLLGLASHLNADAFQQCLASMDTVYGSLHVPKFSIEYQTSLKSTLTRLGMGIAFSDSADFSHLFTPPIASVPLADLLHKAVIQVDEVGTEAITATVSDAVAPSGGASMHIDQSFLFFIRENHTGVIVFAGVLSNPEQG